MPRYFFNVRTYEDYVRDFEGIDMPDLERARWEADQGARGILAKAIKKGLLVDGQKFKVTDESGTLLFSYPFRDALKLV